MTRQLLMISRHTFDTSDASNGSANQRPVLTNERPGIMTWRLRDAMTIMEICYSLANITWFIQEETAEEKAGVSSD